MNSKDYLALKQKLQEKNVSLVAVSKTKPKEDILSLYNIGQRIFGENRVQELVEKQAQLPKDIEWHMIGHLQRNKVKYIAPFVSLIHGVDSFKLLKEVNKQAGKNNRTIAMLLQFHIAQESSKFGFNLEEATEMLQDNSFRELENIEIKGVMGMATFTDNKEQVKAEFKALKNVFTQLKSEYFNGNPSFKEISMGMSGDYKTAVEEGATLVRLGSLIFGHR